MVLGLFDQLQISQLYLIELLGLLTGLGLLQLWHLMYPRLLTGFGMLVFTNLSLTEFQVTYLTLFLSNRQLQVVPDGMSLQEYPVNDLPDDVISDIAIYVDDITLCSKCDQTYDLWQQLELASELESDL